MRPVIFGGMPSKCWNKKWNMAGFFSLWGKCMFVGKNTLIIAVSKRGTCPSHIKSFLQGLFFQLQESDLHVELKSGWVFPGPFVLKHFRELCCSKVWRGFCTCQAAFGEGLGKEQAYTGIVSVTPEDETLWNAIQGCLHGRPGTVCDRLPELIKGKTSRTRSNPISCYHVNGSSAAAKNMSEWTQQGHGENKERRGKDTGALKRSPLCNSVEGAAQTFCAKNPGPIKSGFPSLFQSKCDYC